MNKVNISVFIFMFLCFSLVEIDALTCYSCVGCNDPFAASNGVVVTCNNTASSCQKVSASAGIVGASAVTRGCSISTCVSASLNLVVASGGTYCCNTDLCNDSTSVMKTKSVAASLVAVVSVAIAKFLF